MIDSIKEKAEQNKAKARWSAWSLTAITVSVPVLILIGAELGDSGALVDIVGKILPALFGALAAVLGRWIQVEQPHQRWTLYRHWQRVFEAERLRYREGIGDYAGQDRDINLAEKLAQGQLKLDDQWAAMVPKSKDFVEDHESNP